MCCAFVVRAADVKGGAPSVVQEQQVELLPEREVAAAGIDETELGEPRPEPYSFSYSAEGEFFFIIIC